MNELYSRKTALAVVSALAVCVLFSLFITDNMKGASTAPLQTSLSTYDKYHRSMRSLSNPDYQTDLPEVPRIVHFTMPDNPPTHQMMVVEYSANNIQSHGFEVMIHRDKDIANLIYSNYPHLIEIWEILMNYGGDDKGARVGDFGRMVILYHYGGIYLDGDMVSCRDLSELVDRPGYASFPLINAPQGQVLNSIMSGPPRHPVFGIAVQSMKSKGGEIVEGSILGKTGPIMLGMAIDEYFRVTKLPAAITVREKNWLLPSPDGSKWLESGFVRFGAVMREGIEHTRGLGTLGVLGFVHLHWRTWVTHGAGVASKYSKCDKDLDLIKPFLDFSCWKVEERDNAKWSQCGDGRRHSGMLGLVEATRI